MKRTLLSVALIGLLYSSSAPLMSAEKRNWQERVTSLFDNVGTVVIKKVTSGIKNHYGKMIAGTLGTTVVAFVLIYLRIKNKFRGQIGRV